MLKLEFLESNNHKKNLHAIIDVGKALTEIRDCRLYREITYKLGITVRKLGIQAKDMLGNKSAVMKPCLS